MYLIIPLQMSVLIVYHFCCYYKQSFNEYHCVCICASVYLSISIGQLVKNGIYESKEILIFNIDTCCQVLKSDYSDLYFPPKVYENAYFPTFLSKLVITKSSKFFPIWQVKLYLIFITLIIGGVECSSICFQLFALHLSELLAHVFHPFFYCGFLYFLSNILWLLTL